MNETYRKAQALTNANPWLNTILGQWLKAPNLPRPAVDCGRCSKADSSKKPERWQNFKCCTFQPFVPNFALGKFLKEGGRLPQLKADHSWQALGLLPGLEYRKLYEATSEDDRGENLLCQFYENKRCAIWSVRPTECATHFCIKTGSEALEIAVQSYALETGVAQLVLDELGYDSAKISEQIDWLNGEKKPAAGLNPEEAAALYRKAWDTALKFPRERVLKLL